MYQYSVYPFLLDSVSLQTKRTSPNTISERERRLHLSYCVASVVTSKQEARARRSGQTAVLKKNLKLGLDSTRSPSAFLIGKTLAHQAAPPYWRTPASLNPSRSDDLPMAPARQIKRSNRPMPEGRLAANMKRPRP